MTVFSKKTPETLSLFINFSKKLILTRVFGRVLQKKFAASHLKFKGINGVNHDYTQSTHAASFVYQKTWRRRLFIHTFQWYTKAGSNLFVYRKLEIYPGVSNFEVNSPFRTC